MNEQFINRNETQPLHSTQTTQTTTAKHMKTRAPLAYSPHFPAAIGKRERERKRESERERDRETHTQRERTYASSTISVPPGSNIQTENGGLVVWSLIQPPNRKWGPPPFTPARHVLPKCQHSQKEQAFSKRVSFFTKSQRSRRSQLPIARPPPDPELPLLLLPPHPRAPHFFQQYSELPPPRIPCGPPPRSTLASLQSGLESHVAGVRCLCVCVCVCVCVRVCAGVPLHVCQGQHRLFRL